jgi:tetratricopeptide (TPR) repeat protein
MKHVPAVMLSLCFLLILGLCIFYGFNLFVASNTQLVFGPQEEPEKIQNSEDATEEDKIIILPGEKIWEEMILIENTPEIKNINVIIQNYKARLAANPKDTETAYALGYLNIIKNNAVIARRYFDDVLKVDPGHKSAQLGKAYIYMYTNNDDYTRNILDRLEQDHPEDIDILLTQARYYQHRQEAKLAADYYARALKLDPANMQIKEAIKDFNLSNPGKS